MQSDPEKDEHVRRVLSEGNWISPEEARKGREPKEGQGFVALLLIIGISAAIAFAASIAFNFESNSGFLAVWGMVSLLWITMKWGGK
jgi:hypothetical protein